MQRRLIEEPENNLPEVKGERTFWRDLKLLKRHRDWGWDVPAEDIDFLEYDKEKVVALVEYKMVRDLQQCHKDLELLRRPGNPGHSNLQALENLGQRAQIPLFLAFYNSTRKYFRVFGVDDLGKKQQTDSGLITEYKFVEFLYWLRGRDIPNKIKPLLFGGGY